MGGRDEEDSGKAVICRSREAKREFTDQKIYGGTFFTFFEFGFYFAYLELWSNMGRYGPRAAFCCFFVLGAGMVKDSSPGGMNHPHVFKYPP